MLQVLAFLPLRSPGKRDDFRLATIGEAAVFFKISPDTIKGWVKRKDRILSDERLPTFKAKWDRLEAELFDAFLTQRSNNKICIVWWFGRKAQTIYETLYPGINPGITSIFLFSNGWWAGFRERYNISRRRITKQATKRPEQYIDVVNFL